jgi:signal transduction histidine kinase
VRHSGLHSDESISLHIRINSHLRVEVSDSGPGFDPAKRTAPNDDGGYGLLLVERLADRWGVLHNGLTCVWLELDL